MYEPFEVVQNIDDNLGWFLVFGIVGMLCNWALMLEAIRLGFRDRTFSIALFATYLWTAHDVAFIASWETWFVDLDYWVWQLFFFNILLSVILEVVFYHQMIKFGLDELFPGMARRQALTLLFAGQVVALAALLLVKSAMDDEMFMVLIALTIFSCPVFAIPMANRRGSQRGQSVRINAIYIVMVLGIWPAWGVAHPTFRSWEFIAVGAGTILWCVANIFVLSRMPAYEQDLLVPDLAADHDHAERVG